MYIDADILFALFNKADRYHEKAWQILDKPEQKYTSTAALIELEFVVKREMGEDATIGLKTFVTLLKKKIEIKALTGDLIISSMDFREDYSLGVMDAIHATIALENDGVVASSDESYDRVPRLKRIF